MAALGAPLDTCALVGFFGSVACVECSDTMRAKEAATGASCTTTSWLRLQRCRWHVMPTGSQETERRALTRSSPGLSEQRCMPAGQRQQPHLQRPRT